MDQPGKAEHEGYGENYCKTQREAPLAARTRLKPHPAQMTRVRLRLFLDKKMGPARKYYLTVFPNPCQLVDGELYITPTPGATKRSHTSFARGTAASGSFNRPDELWSNPSVVSSATSAS